MREEIAGLLKNDGWSNIIAAQLSSWDPYNQNTSAEFFDPEWMFGVKKGFDIVIGNPPYLESRHPAFNDNLKDNYQSSVKLRWKDDAKYVTKGSDLLIYFFESAIYNINNEGCVVLITQNSWLDTEYGKKFQVFLLRNTHVCKIVDSDFRYFKSGEGPNINTVISVFKGKKCNKQKNISFARFHENFQQMNMANLIFENEIDENVVSVKKYSLSDPLIQELKWGILLNSSEEELQLLKLLQEKGKLLTELRNVSLSIGQGLNLTKDYFIDLNDIPSLGDINRATIPIHTSADGAIFDITKTRFFIIDKSKLSHQEIMNIKRQGRSVFDSKSTSKKPPRLILPRGIGRHYCALNSIDCFSASDVDIYDNLGTASEETILNLWLFLNSSVAWLLRELIGRKNLGGGMLKAEAIDLDAIPIYMDFNKLDEINEVFHKIKNRQAMSTAEEIYTEVHNRIDQIVFDYLGISEEYRTKIVNTLKNKVLAREKKSIT